MDETAPYLELTHICFAWPGESTPLLYGLNLSLLPGERIGIKGVNGSGKTTLFRCITGLERINSGKIALEGKAIKNETDFRLLRREIGYCLQNAEDQLFLPTVLEDIMFGPLNLGLSQEEAEDRARTTLELTGIADYAQRLTYQLSGGEQKLVALAAVLAMRPAALLLDEPLNGLDYKSASHITNIFANLDCSIIAVSHEADFLAQICENLLELRNGSLHSL